MGTGWSPRIRTPSLATHSGLDLEGIVYPPDPYIYTRIDAESNSQEVKEERNTRPFEPNPTAHPTGPQYLLKPPPPPQASSHPPPGSAIQEISLITLGPQGQNSIPVYGLTRRTRHRHYRRDARLPTTKSDTQLLIGRASRVVPGPPPPDAAAGLLTGAMCTALGVPRRYFYGMADTQWTYRLCRLGRWVGRGGRGMGVAVVVGVIDDESNGGNRLGTAAGVRYG